jgi:hypothetical protein
MLAGKVRGAAKEDWMMQMVLTVGNKDFEKIKVRRGQKGDLGNYFGLFFGIGFILESD